MSKADYKPTIALDFDGVLNTYSRWAGEHQLYEPREGVREFLEELSRDYTLVIHSTRPPNKIVQWLFEHGLMQYISQVTSEKPIAFAQLDDRAICFRGDYAEALAAIRTFKAHWEEK